MNKTVLTNCTLLDGSAGMTPRSNMSVVLEGDTILSVEEGCPSLEEVNLFDLQGHYLMPGLVNLHACLAQKGRGGRGSHGPGRLMMSNPATRALVRLRSAESSRIAMMSGVTTLVSADSPGGIDSLVRDWINIAHVDGPRIVATNLPVVPGGGPSARWPSQAAEGPEQAARCVETLCAGSPDLIRVLATDGSAALDGETLRACCETAHRQNRRVMVWADTPQSVRTALESGADLIQHGAELDDAALDLFRKKGAALVCGLSSLIPGSEERRNPMGPAFRPEQKAEREEMARCIRQALEAGIPVGLGSGAGAAYAPHYDMWRELWWFSRMAGVDAAFALHTATAVNAEIAGLGEVTGTVEAGKCADLLVTDRNPLEDLSALRQPTMVVVRGAVMNPRQFKDKRTEQILDGLMAP